MNTAIKTNRETREQEAQVGSHAMKSKVGLNGLLKVQRVIRVERIRPRTKANFTHVAANILRENPKTPQTTIAVPATLVST